MPAAGAVLSHAAGIAPYERERDPMFNKKSAPSARKKETACAVSFLFVFIRLCYSSAGVGRAMGVVRRSRESAGTKMPSVGVKRMVTLSPVLRMTASGASAAEMR